MNLFEVLKHFRTQINAFAATSVVLNEEGIAIESLSKIEEIDAAAGDAYMIELLKRHLDALKAIGLDSDSEDLAITGPSGAVLARPLNDAFTWTLMVGPGANLPLLRALMRSYHDRIVSSLPKEP